MVHAMVEARHRIVKRQARVAAQAEDVFDAIQLQHADDRFRAVSLLV
jgi:hypothetical protein